MNRTPLGAAATVLAALLVLGLPIALSAAVKLPAVIGDHMVVQQGKPVAVWGWAATKRSRHGPVQRPGKEGRGRRRRQVARRLRPAPGGRSAARDRRARRGGPGDRRPRHPRRRGLGRLRPVQHGVGPVVAGQPRARDPAGEPSRAPPLPRPQADRVRAPRGRRGAVEGLHARRGPAVLGRGLPFRARAPQGARRPRRHDRFGLGRDAHRALDAAGGIRGLPRARADPRQTSGPVR